MARLIWLTLAIIFSSSLSAMWTGNPGEASLIECNLFRKNPSSWSFRLGYLNDWVYKQDFQDEFASLEMKKAETCMKLSTYSAMLMLNFKNKVDLYGLVGSSRLQIDEEIFTKRALGWGVGGKLAIFEYENFLIGGDIKYFETNQKPRYFVGEGLPYNIVSKFRLRYQETQAALGIACRSWIFAPYINGTYIDARIDPHPKDFLVRFPDEDAMGETEANPIIGKKKWGLALGLTLIDAKKGSLSFEWRSFNQNAIDVNGEIRF